MDSATQVASAVVPFVVAAVRSYGGRTLEKMRDTVIDSASNTSLSWGRKILARLIGNGTQPLEDAITDLQTESYGADAAAALRLQIRKVLAEDPGLLADIAEMLNRAGQATESVSASDFHVTQNAASLGNSKQAVVGSGIQNVNFGEHEPNA